jgi:amidase
MMANNLTNRHEKARSFMSHDEVAGLGASELAARIRERQLSSREIVEALITRNERLHPRLNAVVTLDAERARAAAHEADEALARGELRGVLHGVPFTVKDTFETAGLRTTAGSPAFADYVPAQDASVCARLRAAGAILLGKTNTPPMAALPQTDNPVFGRTNNPWNLGRTPGGSSGGSAAAVAAGLVPLDIGSDLSGSLRIPAQFCGVYAFKPTARRASIAGHIPDPPGIPRIDRCLGQPGPMARSVADLGLALSVLCGVDARDTETAPVPWQSGGVREPRSLRVAFAPTLPGVPVRREIRDAVTRCAKLLEAAGAEVSERLPDGDLGAHRKSWLAHLACFTRHIATLYPEPPAFAVRSEAKPPELADQARALAGRDQAIHDWEALLAEVDVFMCPLVPVTAFPHCAPGTPLDVDGVQVESWRIDHFLYPFNFTGHPSAALPAGLDAEGLPLGVQLVARRWADEALLASASAIDAVIQGYRRPDLSAMC